MKVQLLTNGLFDKINVGMDMGGERILNEGYFVGWGTLALINAGIAQGKNRSGLNWFLISLLLGPIATFLLVLFDKLPGE
ncbi:hypothetical protein [Pseudogracilibacillus sp. SO30301A]|uniref:hypothetical protein n=1 Tax=Pseudogracilibacillus sp. SO30301A TaxID=3098291 RepID=UPI00300E3299